MKYKQLSFLDLCINNVDEIDFKCFMSWAKAMNGF